MNSDRSLSVSGLSFTYPSGPSFRFPDFRLEAQGQLLVLGASGVGKSTLLHLLAGLRRPQSGRLQLGGTRYSALPPKALDKFRGQHIGVVFQQPHFIQALTVEENLQLIQRVSGRGEGREHRNHVLQSLGIWEERGRSPQRLSQGQQQRVALAMALANRPALILADEPTASLDDHSCDQVLRLLQREAAENQAHLLVITHDQRVKQAFEQQLLLTDPTAT